MSGSALERLAWASLPERVIVSRVANGLLRRHIDGSRGEKREIKEAVRESYPPRGMLGKRFDAVMAELKRQDVIRNKRGRYRPFVWGRSSTSIRRNNVARGRLNSRGSISSCIDIRSLPGHSLYLINSYESYPRKTLVVRHHATGIEDEVVVGDSADSVGEAVHKLHRRQIDRVLQYGGFYTVDFCRLCTTVYPLDGPSEDLFWDLDGEPHPLHRPRQAQCENWA